MPKGNKDLQVEFTCPLGSECEEIRDKKIYRCMWYTKVSGEDPNTSQFNQLIAQAQGLDLK